MKDSFDLFYGDIILVDFAPTEGHEESGKRPGVILTNNSYNERSYMKFVVPLTTTHRDFPMNVTIDEDDEEDVYGDVLVNHGRFLDLSGREYEKIGHLSDGRMHEITNTLFLSLKDEE